MIEGSNLIILTKRYRPSNEKIGLIGYFCSKSLLYVLFSALQ
jgi:hypothetical protein